MMPASTITASFGGDSRLNPIEGLVSARRRSPVRFQRGQRNTMTAAEATRQLAGEGTNRSVVFSAMRAVQRSFGTKAAAQLAAIAGCDEKTAQRYFSRKRTPNAETLVAVMRSPVGADFVRATIDDLPRDQRQAFFMRLMNL